MEGDYKADLALSVLQLHAHSDLLHAHLLLHRLRAAIQTGYHKGKRN